jgi:hypothetical protein
MPGAPGRLGRQGEDQRDPAYPQGKVAQMGARRADPVMVRHRNDQAAVATTLVLVSGRHWTRGGGEALPGGARGDGA